MGNMAILGIFLLIVTFAVAEKLDYSLLFSRMPQYTGRMKETNMNRIAYSSNDRGFALYGNMMKESEENIFFSPFTISTVLNMLYKGAKGETARELRELLGYSNLLPLLSMGDRHVFYTYRIFFTDVLETLNPTLYNVSCASAVLVDKSFPLLPSYKADIQNYFRAYVQEVNFADNASDIKEELNSWASFKTGGQITDLVDSIDPETTLLVASAAYFKGLWKVPFDPKDTKYHPFYNEGQPSSAKQVLMMNVTSRYPYYNDESGKDNFTAIQVPYEGKNMSMLIILPKFDDGLADIVEDLSALKVKQIREKMNNRYVHLTMPKLKLESNNDLLPYVRKLGVYVLSTPRVNFSGMTEVKAKCNLRLNELKHKAAIDIDEEGATAAGVGTLPQRRPRQEEIVEFKLDRPFMFMIIEKRSKIILFMGSVSKL